MAAAVRWVVPQGLNPLVILALFGTRPRGYPGRALIQGMFLKHAVVKLPVGRFTGRPVSADQKANDSVSHLDVLGHQVDKRGKVDSQEKDVG